MTSDVKYIITNRFGAIALARNDSGFWVDSQGTLYAYSEGVVVDSVNRCGIWPLALPLWPMFQEANDSCAVHDFLYSSPLYQAFHTRAEADTYLQRLLDISGHPLLGEVFSDVARLLGVPYWEGKK